MTIDLAQATDLAQQHLLASETGGMALQLLTDLTKEFDAGWVFYYQSKRYIETGDFVEIVVGNAPLFISRSDGAHFSVGYHRPIDESLAAYRACGDPNAQEAPEVRMTGWRKGALTVSAIQAVRHHAAVGFAQAKFIVDSCLHGESPIVQLVSVAEARALISSLASIGFQAEMCFVQPQNGQRKC